MNDDEKKSTKKTTTKKIEDKKKSTNTKKTSASKTSTKKKSESKVSNEKKVSTKKTNSTSKRKKTTTKKSTTQTKKKPVKKEQVETKKVVKKKEEIKEVKPLFVIEETKPVEVTEVTESKESVKEKKEENVNTVNIEEEKIVKKEDVDKQEVINKDEDNLIDLDKEDKELLENKEVVEDKVETIKDVESKEELVEVDNADDIKEVLFKNQDIDTLYNNYEKKIENEEIKEDKKIKKYNIIEPIIVLIILFICFAGFYYFMFLSPRAIVNNYINKTFNILDNEINELKDSNYKDKVSLSSDIKFSSNNEEYGELINYIYKLKLNIDSENNKFSGLFEVNDTNNDIINTLFKKEDNNLYLLDSNLYYYPIVFTEIENNLKDSNDLNKLSEISSEFKDIISKELTYKNINKTDETINLNYVDLKVNTLNISYSSEEINSIINNIINDIKNDNILYDDLKDMFDISEDELNEVLNSDFSVDRDIQLKIYTKGIFNDYVGFAIYSSDELLFRYTKYEDNNEIKFLDTDSYSTIEYNDDSFVVSYSDIKIIELKRNYSDKDVLSYDFTINCIVSKYKGNISIKDISDNQENIKVSFVNSNDSSQNGELEFNITYSDYNDDVELNTDDAVNVNDLTSEEVDSITNSLYSLIF